MKLLRRTAEQFVFQLGKREHRALAEMLAHYPLVPPAHHRIGDAASPPGAETQRLLDEALAEQREANRKQVSALLAPPHCQTSPGKGWELTITPAQLECLLQVLNDVRVGSWLLLGEPEAGHIPAITTENLRYLAALEVCGLFQSVLLAALGMEQSSEWH